MTPLRDRLPHVVTVLAREIHGLEDAEVVDRYDSGAVAQAMARLDAKRASR